MLLIKNIDSGIPLNLILEAYKAVCIQSTQKKIKRTPETSVIFSVFASQKTTIKI
jgi:hypothetical protein